MTRQVQTAKASESVGEAAARMHAHRVGSLVVIDAHGPIGIITERDLLDAATSGADFGSAAVSEFMTAQPDVLSSDVEVSEALAQLCEKQYRHGAWTTLIWEPRSPPGVTSPHPWSTVLG